MIDRESVGHVVNRDRLHGLVEVQSSVLFRSVTLCHEESVEETISESKEEIIRHVYGDMAIRLRELYRMVFPELNINAPRTEIERRFRELSRMMDGHKPEPTGESK